MSPTSALLLTLLGACGGPSLNVHVAGLNPAPTDDNAVELSADGGTARFVQPVDLGFAGESTNLPEGEVGLALSVHVTGLKLGAIAVPIDRTVDLDVPYRVRGGDIQGASTVRVELEVPLDAALADALRPSCGEQVPVWFEATWKAEPRGALPDGWALAGGSGELHNLLDPPMARIGCPAEEAVAPE
ncbi:MAG: hypothetical protein H6737_14180 [Alphaproteobacteria bacterium]|nr:hypothetical protein [Alphaproteobacteria bacterium]